MAQFSLVGDIGGTNSRFGLVEKGSMMVREIESQKNDGFPSLEASVTHYLKQRGVTSLHAAARVTRIVVPQNGNCDSLGSRIAGEVKRIVFRADCITERFGAYIAAEIANVKTASLIKAGLVSAAQARNLVLAVIMQESKGNALAVMVPENPKNAISEGLMQVTPETMRAFGGGSAFNPRENIHAGYGALTTYTALFVGLPHAIERGLVGYNMGPYGRNRAFLYRSD